MTPTDLTFSWMLWLSVGFLIGYRYHVLKVRDIQARRIKRMALEWVYWRAPVKEVTGSDVGDLPADVVALANTKKMLEEARN